MFTEQNKVLKFIVKQNRHVIQVNLFDDEYHQETKKRQYDNFVVAQFICH